MSQDNHLGRNGPGRQLHTAESGLFTTFGVKSCSFVGTADGKQRHWQGNNSGTPPQKGVQLFMINLAVAPEVSSDYGSFAVSHMIIYFSSKKDCFYEKLQ